MIAFFVLGTWTLSIPGLFFGLVFLIAAPGFQWHPFSGNPRAVSQVRSNRVLPDLWVSLCTNPPFDANSVKFVSAIRRKHTAFTPFPLWPELFQRLIFPPLFEALEAIRLFPPPRCTVSPPRTMLEPFLQTWMTPSGHLILLRDSGGGLSGFCPWRWVQDPPEPATIVFPLFHGM